MARRCGWCGTIKSPNSTTAFLLVHERFCHSLHVGGNLACRGHLAKFRILGIILFDSHLGTFNATSGISQGVKQFEVPLDRLPTGEAQWVKRVSDSKIHPVISDWLLGDSISATVAFDSPHPAKRIAYQDQTLALAPTPRLPNPSLISCPSTGISNSLLKLKASAKLKHVAGGKKFTTEVAGVLRQPRASREGVSCREVHVGGFVVVQRKAGLTQIVFTLRQPSGFTNRLNGRKQHANQDSNDCDNDKQLHKREA